MPKWFELLQEIFDPKVHTNEALHKLHKRIRSYYSSEQFSAVKSKCRMNFLEDYGLEENKDPPLSKRDTFSRARNSGNKMCYSIVSQIADLVHYIPINRDIVKDCFRILYKVSIDICFKHAQAFILIFTNFLEPESLQEQRFRVAAKIFESIKEHDLGRSAQDHLSDPLKWLDCLNQTQLGEPHEKVTPKKIHST